ncbi:uncharacterized protein LOC125022337 [Mugil cephalus]|uniref:uncharacterized protein LOC125022337 n=1 Tax=Mugil cephalus TaxID=48193 RepID=UPI001FB7C82F|nr:uncharacterized protein LOC125022337 [Mugil cephalus]
MGGDFMGASGSPDPGNKAVGECGKRLSDSLWASEDLSCRSENVRDPQTNRGSPEWTGGVDPQRAISLDASGCQTEMSNLALVRSTALEDLTAIGDRGSWDGQGVELVPEHPEDGPTPGGAAFTSCSDSGNKSITQQAPHAQSLPLSSFDSHVEDLHSAETSGNISEKDRHFAKLPSDTAAESSSDSWSHRAGSSEPDISNDSETRSSVVQTTGTAQLQKTSQQSASARKSLVPVAVFKGLFAVMFTSSEPALFSLLLPLL